MRPPVYLEDTDRRGASTLPPEERHAVGVPLHIPAQWVGRLVRVAPVIDEQVGNFEAVDEAVDRPGVRRLRRDAQAAGLPVDFAGVSAQDGPGPRGVAGDPAAGRVEVGVRPALSLGASRRDGVGRVGERGGQDDPGRQGPGPSPRHPSDRARNPLDGPHEQERHERDQEPPRLGERPDQQERQRREGDEPCQTPPRGPQGPRPPPDHDAGAEDGPQIRRAGDGRGASEDRPDLHERAGDLVGDPLEVEESLFGDPCGQPSSLEEADLGGLANGRQPAGPGEDQDHGGQARRPERPPAPAKAQVDCRGRGEADPDVPGQDACGQGQPQDAPDADATTAPGPDRGEHREHLQEGVERLRLDRPPAPPPGPVQRQGEPEEQGRPWRGHRPEPSPGQEHRDRRTQHGKGVAGDVRAAEGPPDEGQGGRIPGGEMGVSGRPRQVDLSVSAARGQCFAEDGVTGPVESRGGRQVRIQPDRGRRDGRQEDARAEGRADPPRYPSHAPRLLSTRPRRRAVKNATQPARSHLRPRDDPGCDDRSR